MQSNCVGAMFGLFFDTNDKVTRLIRCMQGLRLIMRYFHLMLQQGVYFAPSAYEAGFVSSSHQSVDFNDTLRAFNVAVAQITEDRESES